MTPIAPTRPEPRTAVGSDAPLVVCAGGPLPPLLEGERVGELTVVVALLPPVGLPLMVPAVSVAVLVSVVVSSALEVVVAAESAGYSCGRMVLTSAGSAWYQSGVLPAASEEYISDWKAAVLVAARASADGGSAVRSTSMTDDWTL